MNPQVLISGGGIGGLAAALACARAGLPVQLLEQAAAFSEVGAGLQLGPNAVRVLCDWGLEERLHASAAFPDLLVVRDAHSASELGQLRLGALSRARYGQPYATLHRADLHTLLLETVQTQPGVQLLLGARLASYEEEDAQVRATTENEVVHVGAALLGCDGLWSRVRQQLLGAQPVRASGHLAYRGMVLASDLPAHINQPKVSVWLAPRLHVVHYPVRGGGWFNVVAVVEGVIGQGHGGAVDADPQSWTHEAHASDLRRTLGPACTDLLAMIEAVPQWTLWLLNDRPPMAGPHEHARGRVALLGDAAHPLRPYLAQGAAMALEDAWTLGVLLKREQGNGADLDWPELLARLAEARWQRNARVQRQSERNGRIFHAAGPVRWARNVAMSLLGEDLLDNPWLYSGPPVPPGILHDVRGPLKRSAGRNRT